MFHYNNLHGDIWDGINLPTGNNDIDQFEKNNKLDSIIVFGPDDWASVAHKRSKAFERPADANVVCPSWSYLPIEAGLKSKAFNHVSLHLYEWFPGQCQKWCGQAGPSSTLQTWCFMASSMGAVNVRFHFHAYRLGHLFFAAVVGAWTHIISQWLLNILAVRCLLFHLSYLLKPQAKSFSSGHGAWWGKYHHVQPY